MKLSLYQMVTGLALAASLHAQEIDFPFKSRLVFNSDFQGNHEIYMLQENRLTRLTDHPATDQYPVPSHGKDRLVFTSNRNGNFDIYIMDLKSREIRQLTRDLRDELDPSWSHDDRTVFYITRTANREWLPMKIDVETGDKGELFPGSDFTSIITPMQSNSGNAFFFTFKTLLGWRVGKYDTHHPRIMPMAPRATCRPKISFDDRQVAYVSHEDDGIGDIWVMNADGTAPRNRTPERRDTIDYYPAFSPDNKSIVFSSSPKSKGKEAYDLFILDLDSGQVRPAFRSSGNDIFPYWMK